MFRFLFRFAGLVVIAISFLFVVYDGTKSIADQTTYISRVGPTWVNIHPNSLSAFEPAVETLAGAWVWNDVVQPYFLEQPTELVLVIIGALLVLLGSKKRPRGPHVHSAIQSAIDDFICHALGAEQDQIA